MMLEACILNFSTGLFKGKRKEALLKRDKFGKISHLLLELLVIVMHSF